MHRFSGRSGSVLFLHKIRCDLVTFSSTHTYTRARNAKGRLSENDKKKENEIHIRVCAESASVCEFRFKKKSELDESGNGPS